MSIPAHRFLGSLLTTLVLGACASDKSTPPTPSNEAPALATQSLGLGKSSVGWPERVVAAENSVHLKQGSHVTGDVAARTASAGPVLADGSELVVGIGSRVDGAVTADSLKVKTNGIVYGSATYNERSGEGSVTGKATPTLALPVNGAQPSFPTFAAGTEDITLVGKEDRTLPPGEYADVLLKGGSKSDPTVLALSGGTYAFGSLDLGDRSRVECTAACELRIKGRLAPGSNSYLGPAASAGLEARDVVVFVEGQNGSTGKLGGNPKAAVIGLSSELTASVFVPNGSLLIKQNSVARGTFVAKDVMVGIGATVTKSDAPPNSEQCGTTASVKEPVCPDGSTERRLSDGDDSHSAAAAGECIIGLEGRDTISAAIGSATVYGGADDDIIFAGLGNNTVIPGPGRDTVSTGNGDDTIIIYDVCEVAGGETIAAGLGHDVLISPVSAAELQALGVVMDGIDEVVIQQNSCKSECVAPPDCGCHGSCAEGATHGAVLCECDPGFAGDDCSEPTDTCTPTATNDTTCNGVDDDCDGVVDEDFAVGCDGDAVTSCVGGAIVLSSCGNGNVCDGVETCEAGACVAGTPIDPNDNNACTEDSCDSATGVINAAIDPDDNNACTTDSCDPAAGVVNAPVDPNDNNACTTDSCDPATGIINTTIDPDDDNACTTDSCDPATGVINTTIDPDDNDACTTDSCDPATCGCQPANRQQSRTPGLGRRVVVRCQTSACVPTLT